MKTMTIRDNEDNRTYDVFVLEEQHHPDYDLSAYMVCEHLGGEVWTFDTDCKGYDILSEPA